MFDFRKSAFVRFVFDAAANEPSLVCRVGGRLPGCGAGLVAGWLPGCVDKRREQAFALLLNPLRGEQAARPAGRSSRLPAAAETVWRRTAANLFGKFWATFRSFSAVSATIFASNYAFFSIF